MLYGQYQPLCTSALSASDYPTQGDLWNNFIILEYSIKRRSDKSSRRHHLIAALPLPLSHISPAWHTLKSNETISLFLLSARMMHHLRSCQAASRPTLSHIHHSPSQVNHLSELGLNYRAQDTLSYRLGRVWCIRKSCWEPRENRRRRPTGSRNANWCWCWCKHKRE